MPLLPWQMNRTEDTRGPVEDFREAGAQGVVRTDSGQASSLLSAFGQLWVCLLNFSTFPDQTFPDFSLSLQVSSSLPTPRGLASQGPGSSNFSTVVRAQWSLSQEMSCATNFPVSHVVRSTLKNPKFQALFYQSH